MARPKSKAPARRYHISGQSVVTIGGRDFYLGPHDSPESIARYAALVIHYQSTGMALPDDFDPASLDIQAAKLPGQLSPQAAAADQAKQPTLVRHITAAHRTHIAVKYGESPAEIHRLASICDDIDKHDGNVAAIDYAPLRLQAQRQRWIDSGKARVYCNRLTNAVKRIWKFAVSQELVTSSYWESLRCIEALQVGQTTAPETDPVLPADIIHVRATAKHLSPVVKAMMRVQIATGMRPSDTVTARQFNARPGQPVCRSGTLTNWQALEAVADCRLPSFSINSVRLRSQCRVATAYRAIESAGWNDNLTAPAIQATTRIPPTFRSKPITKKVAAKLLGRGCEDSGVKWLNDCIADGTITCEELTRQSFVFDIREFPESVHQRLLPPKSF